MDEKYLGNDNYGISKSKFIENLKKTSDEDLLNRCEHYIWLSAYASNNPRSDYHWQCDACYDECKNRNKLHIYEKAHKSAFE